jgi:hypothetical protein
MKKIGLIIAFILLVSGNVYADYSITLAWEGSDDPTISYLLFARGEGEDYDYDKPLWSGYEQTCKVEVVLDHPTYFVVRAFDDVNDIESGDSNEVMFDTTDSDSDGLPDAVEEGFGTDPNDADSDHDGINDGDEYDYWGSPENLLIADSDGDGYLDGDEINNGGDPLDPDYGPSVLVLEDAEDESIERWASNHKKSVVTNVYNEDLDSRVINLHGKNCKHKFVLLNLETNTQLFVISCKLNYAKRFYIVVTAITESGKDRKFILKPGRVRVKGKHKKIKVFLGKKLARNIWHDVTIDLQDALSSVQPDEKLAGITGLYVKTKKDFKIDNLKLQRTTLN